MFAIMPKSGDYRRPVDRPGRFLLSASEIYFKRAWAKYLRLSALSPAKSTDNPLVGELLAAVDRGLVHY